MIVNSIRSDVSFSTITREKKQTSGCVNRLTISYLILELTDIHMIFPGPNYKHLFTSKTIHPELQFGDTSDLYDHIVFYFDAKVIVSLDHCYWVV